MKLQLGRKYKPVHIVFETEYELAIFVHFLEKIPAVHSGIPDELWNQLNAYMKVITSGD